MENKNDNVTDDLKAQELKNKVELLHEVKNRTGATKVTLIEQRNRPKLPANVMVFQKFALLASCSKKFSTASIRIMLYIIGIMRYENTFYSLDITHIATDLDISERTVSRSLKQLKEMNFIISIPSPEDNRRREYAVNPQAMWRGNSSARVEKMKRMDNKTHQLQLFETENLHSLEGGKEFSENII